MMQGLGQRNMYMVLIDYKKVYDSVPDSWRVYVLMKYNIYPRLVSLLRIVLNSWRTIIQLNANDLKDPMRNLPRRFPEPTLVLQLSTMLNGLRF